MTETVAVKLIVEVGLTGPDWEPAPSTKYYAQIGKEYAFGPTKREAVAALKRKVESK